MKIVTLHIAFVLPAAPGTENRMPGFKTNANQADPRIGGCIY
ncbi:MAG: hypothetical protein AAFQ05_15285 [Pseudomonadota bacterium]